VHSASAPEILFRRCPDTTPVPARLYFARADVAAPSIAGCGEDGMSTAEYAVGTVAACAFAGLLFKIVTSDEVAGLIRGVISRGFGLVS